MRRTVANGLVLLLILVAACTDDGAGPASTTSTPPTGPSVTLGSRPRGFEVSVEPVTADDLPASWRDGCPVGPGDLRLVHVRHWGFDLQAHDGTLVVHEDVVDPLLQVFEDLWDARYPIERMEPVDVYGGSDEASMDANNTSAFNCRPATGGSGWSEHAYGRAVDLNPLQNPYVRGDTVLPPQSARYVDRTSTDQGVIHAGDPAVTAFAEQGWVWGGTWSTLKDYQHFSPSGR